MCGVLKNTDETVRKKARKTFVQIAEELGPRYLPYILSELKSNLNKGFMVWYLIASSAHQPHPNANPNPHPNKHKHNWTILICYYCCVGACFVLHSACSPQTNGSYSCPWSNRWVCALISWGKLRCNICKMMFICFLDNYQRRHWSCRWSSWEIYRC